MEETPRLSVADHENDLTINIRDSSLITKGISSDQPPAPSYCCQNVPDRSSTPASTSIIIAPSGLLHIVLDNVTIMTLSTELYQGLVTRAHGIYAAKYEQMVPATFSSKRLVARSLRRGRDRTASLLIRLERMDGSGDSDVRTNGTDITTHGEGAVGHLRLAPQRRWRDARPHFWR